MYCPLGNDSLNAPLVSVDVPFSGTKEMIVALDILGSTVLRYEEPTGYGHDVWSYAARTVEIWTWLFEQTREGR